MGRRGGSLSKEQALELALQVWRLRTGPEQLTQTEIGKRLGITQQAVSYILRTHRQKAREGLSEMAQLELIIQLEELDMIKREAIRAWFKSKEAVRKKIRKRKGLATGIQVNGRHGSNVIDFPGCDSSEVDQLNESELSAIAQVETTCEIRYRLADPRYLMVAMAAMRGRRELLGVRGLDQTGAGQPALVRVPLKLLPSKWIEQTRSEDTIGECDSQREAGRKS